MQILVSVCRLSIEEDLIFAIGALLYFLFLAANPDITVKKVTDDHEFLFLACDGMFYSLLRDLHYDLHHETSPF